VYDYGELTNKTISHRLLAALSDLDVSVHKAVTTAMAEALERRKHDVSEGPAVAQAMRKSHDTGA
jgi:post-segregation antitoxin (ccd killing protein)